MPMPTRPLPEYLNFRRFLLVDEIDGVVVITLRRPQAMNALNDAVTDELLDVIREREDDEDVLGFVITGYGARSFCAGADIGSFPELLGNAEAAAGFARDCSRLLVPLDAMEKPVVAAINGMALGGGLELALRCHSMVATAGAWMQLPEVTLGIAPGIGALTVPYRRWPEAAAVFHDMLRLGRKLKAEDAHEMGILDGLSDDMSGLVPLALARVRQLSGKVTRIPDGRCEIAAPSPVEPRNKHEESLPADTQAIIEEAIVACVDDQVLMQCHPCLIAPPLVLLLVVLHPAQSASTYASTTPGLDCHQYRRTPLGAPIRYRARRFINSQSSTLGVAILRAISFTAN